MNQETYRSICPPKGTAEACSLTVVLRAIFSLLDSKGRQEWLSHNIDFLKVSLDDKLMLDRDYEQKQQDAARALLESSYEGKTPSPYIELAECELLLNTLWASSSMKLISKFLVRKKEGDKWSDWGPVNVSDRDLADWGLVDYDMTKEREGTSLSEVACRRLCIFKKSETLHLDPFFACPMIMRVRHVPGQRKLDFIQLQRFVMCIYYKRPYYLLAAVRIDDNGKETERVRLYRPFGDRITTKCEDKTVSAHYMDDEWNVGEPGFVYMLYYLQTSDLKPEDPGDDQFVPESDEARRIVASLTGGAEQNKRQMVEKKAGESAAMGEPPRAESSSSNAAREISTSSITESSQAAQQRRREDKGKDKELPRPIASSGRTNTGLSLAQSMSSEKRPDQDQELLLPGRMRLEDVEPVGAGSSDFNQTSPVSPHHSTKEVTGKEIWDLIFSTIRSE
ncbi:hypothetical protein D7B24_003312 [Verticillium nonalfalfae]|uniref:Uncharacterized protein n=1 Tax=Verticillium nonalfalfae TaxID=1051616 RepID=A0A3M9XWE1_9PEZI|nr:uncharacterized protein D7B24_003312 [Verticillium nonalfalfae]RNJ52569.1 hypothetical protein D7B24_003312 [Verticillium nonalfalfae]